MYDLSVGNFTSIYFGLCLTLPLPIVTSYTSTLLSVDLFVVSGFVPSKTSRHSG